MRLTIVFLALATTPSNPTRLFNDGRDHVSLSIASIRVEIDRAKGADALK